MGEERKTVGWQFDRRKHKPVPPKLYRSCVCKLDPESGLYEISRFCPFLAAKELLACTAPGGSQGGQCRAEFVDGDSVVPYDARIQ